MKKHYKMLKQYFSNQTKRTQYITATLVVLVVAGIGTYLLIGSHAATPYASITADSGTLANGATKQTCSGSSDGSCIVFNGTGGSGGGGNGNMAVGLVSAAWDSAMANDVHGAVNYQRLDSSFGPTPSSFWAVGGQSDALFSGPYNTNGVSSINATSWANSALSWYKTNCPAGKSECPSIEVLNEPGGFWFWGSNGGNQVNATSYANLVKTAYTTFHVAFGSNSPLVLASADGSWGTPPNAPPGTPGYETWIYEWWNQSMSSYLDGIIIHPYGGTNFGNASQIEQSAQGNRQEVSDVHTLTNKPIYITEVGWPTNDAGPSVTNVNATGDSLQWPQNDSPQNQYPGLDQCDNVYNFVSWARSIGYVNAVYIFNELDGPTPGYGVEAYIANPSTTNTGLGTHKDSYFSLGDASQNKPNPCPRPSNGYRLQ